MISVSMIGFLVGEGGLSRVYTHVFPWFYVCMTYSDELVLILAKSAARGSGVVLLSRGGLLTSLDASSYLADGICTEIVHISFI